MFSNKIQKLILNTLVFLLPTQIAYHFWPNYAFVFGIRVDYLSPTIYFTDILIAILIFLNVKKIIKYKKTLFLILLFAVINIYFSTIYQLTAYKWLKIFEYIFLGIIIKKKNILTPLYYSLVFFSIIGILQFLLGSTTGVANFLGERTFDVNTPGIALTEIFGKNYLRIYSTFPHPNSLAGYLGAGIIFLQHKKYKFSWTICFIIIAFILTFSLSATIAVLVYFALRGRLNKSFILLTIISSMALPFFLFLAEIDRGRLTLAIESAKVISQYFFEGSGLGTFPSISSIRQPVHNLYLLIFSELGIFGLLGTTYLLFKYYRKYSFLLFILTVGLFDHYILTLNQNMLLLSLLFSLW